MAWKTPKTFGQSQLLFHPPPAREWYNRWRGFGPGPAGDEVCRRRDGPFSGSCYLNNTS